MCSPTACATSVDVLIAEDDPVIRLAVRQILEEEGYTCAELEDGRDVLDVAVESRPRLVLLDLMMPGIDGFTAAEQLRADPRTRDIKIHCLTALDFPAARRAALRSGCDVFLSKPFDVEGLLDVVRVALHKGSQEPQAELARTPESPHIEPAVAH
jgi:CheY-like chemotaxis protein